jgi:radical SAM superfamily enzyme YgiQ (UPF0313 family)
VKVLLISTYELGRQPFGIASAAAWLRNGGHEVCCIDTAVSALSADCVREAEFVAISLPMHTATRLAVDLIARVKDLNGGAHLCCFGLYAPINAEYLRSLGVKTFVGGEFERLLVNAVDRVAAGSAQSDAGPLVSLERLRFLPPDRSGLPSLDQYTKLRVGSESKRAGYTEGSRGCKHLCRHCPVVPVYNGTFRVVQQDIVLEDIRRQVAAGAEHITFGDPDFFNGPAHARRLVEALHEEHPELTYDVTIKIEHLLKHSDLLAVLKGTNCLFVTSAVESLQDEVLNKLDKGHTCADFTRVVALFRQFGLTLSPTFIPFTPWTTRESYRDLLDSIVELDLVENVSPVQLALRLLVPPGSRLLELAEVQLYTTGYDPAALIHRWSHSDPEVDRLAARALSVVHEGQKQRLGRAQIFRK